MGVREVEDDEAGDDMKMMRLLLMQMMMKGDDADEREEEGLEMMAAWGDVAWRRCAVEGVEEGADEYDA